MAPGGDGGSSPPDNKKSADFVSALFFVAEGGLGC
jgi:hypothetical protein